MHLFDKCHEVTHVQNLSTNNRKSQLHLAFIFTVLLALNDCRLTLAVMLIGFLSYFSPITEVFQIDISD